VPPRASPFGLSPGYADYMGSAPVVAQANVYFPARFRTRVTRVEPLPAQ